MSDISSYSDCDCEDISPDYQYSFYSPNLTLQMEDNMKKTTPKTLPQLARKLVSKQKKRYTHNGYDLDLSYVTENIIAMGFPAMSYEKYYRNPYNEVYSFLEERHKDHYKVYNLCKEKKRQYDYSIFHNRVSCFPFSDHNPPKLEQILDFCNDVQEWFDEDPNNIGIILIYFSCCSL